MDVDADIVNGFALGSVVYSFNSQTVEGRSAQLPFVQLDQRGPRKRTVIWLDDVGKGVLFAKDGSISADAQRMLVAGASVIGVDLLYQGDFLADGKPPTRQRRLEGEEGHCGWTYCYNLPLLAQRASDILAVIEASKAEGRAKDVPIEIVARGPAAIWAAAAIVQSRGAVSRAALDTQAFRFADLNDVYDVNFLPGAVKYGDVPGLLALVAPTRLILAGESELPKVVTAAYRAAGAMEYVTATDKDMIEAIVDPPE